MTTHAWIDTWRWLKQHRPRLHELARRLQIIESPLSRLAGGAFTLLVFMVTCLFVFDHRTNGLPMLGRLFGIRSQHPQFEQNLAGRPDNAGQTMWK
jgi:hypothetical protein